MAKLDSDDLKAIKDLIEVTVEDVIERKELAFDVPPDLFPISPIICLTIPTGNQGRILDFH